MSVWQMFKKLAIILVSVIIIGLNVPGSNNFVQASQLSGLNIELSDVIGQIEQETDRLKLVDLIQEENKIAKLVRAYDLAINLNDTESIKLTSFYFDQTSDKPAVVQVGEQWISNSVYAFGGGRNSIDIARGLFDCSSFVHWAFDQIGLSLGDRTSVTTDTLKKLGTQISIDDILPGDLVFFDTYKIDGHVGIYAGNGQFIGSQSSTGVDYADMTTGYWADKFNNRVIRIDEAY